MKRTVLLAAIVSLSGAAHGDEIRAGGTGAAHGVMLLLGEAFNKAYPAQRVEVVPGLGSGGGIAAVQEGALQFAFSGRTLKREEAAGGLEQIAAYDTPFLFVTSHPQPQALKQGDIVAIYGDVLATWPDGRPIKPILRPKSDSSTTFLYEHFAGMEAAMDRLRRRSDVPVAATDQDNIQTAERIPNSLTGATLAQILTERPRLRSITYDGVAASIEAMERGAYPLRVRIYVIVKAERPAAAQRFLQFLASPPAAAILRQNGAVPVAATTASVR